MSFGSDARRAAWRWLTNRMVAVGYLYGRAYRVVRFRKRYRRAAIGPLWFRVPMTWGEFEPAPEGDFVIRNKPTRHMIDGDILWYSSIGEIRVRRPGGRGLPDLAPMDEVQRTVITPQGPVLVLARVGRGMSARRRSEAQRVLASVRVRRRREPLIWPHPKYEQGAATSETAAP